jgi:translation initiation factor IF-2
MKQRKHSGHRDVKKGESRRISTPTSKPTDKEKEQKLEIVLKCDAAGSEEAVLSSLSVTKAPEIELKVIHSDVGDVTKSDLLIALTGSRLVVGFNVGVGPKTEQLCKEQGIEVRLYDVIYQLTNDMQQIANSLVPRDEEGEKITGKARVIALFKSSRKGIILGCEVLEGTLALGKRFRIISAMGPIYSGKIDSLHIEQDEVKEAGAHQQVGLKVFGLKKATLGDLVECFESVPSKRRGGWQPKGGVSKRP